MITIDSFEKFYISFSIFVLMINNSVKYTGYFRHYDCQSAIVHTEISLKKE